MDWLYHLPIFVIVALVVLPTTILNLSCGEFTKPNYVLETRIVNGEYASLGEFPWQVSIQRLVRPKTMNISAVNAQTVIVYPSEEEIFDNTLWSKPLWPILMSNVSRNNITFEQIPNNWPPPLPTYPPNNVSFPPFPTIKPWFPSIPSIPSLKPWMPPIPSLPSLKPWPPSLPTLPSIKSWPPALPTLPSLPPWPPSIPTLPSLQPWPPSISTSLPQKSSTPSIPTQKPDISTVSSQQPTSPSFPTHSTSQPSSLPFPTHSSSKPSLPPFPTFSTQKPSLPPFPTFPSPKPSFPPFPTHSPQLPQLPSFPQQPPRKPSLPPFPTFSTQRPTSPPFSTHSPSIPSSPSTPKHWPIPTLPPSSPKTFPPSPGISTRLPIIPSITTQKPRPPQHDPSKRWHHFCGGSIIDQNWILTAAHCVENLKYDYVPGTIRILAGSTNWRNIDNEYAQLISVDKIIVHDQWSQKLGQNDIALLHLATPVQFVQTDKVLVNKICLSKEAQFEYSGTSTSSGWGFINKNIRITPDLLRRVDLPVVDHLNCKYAFRKVIGISENQVCAGKAPKGNCMGDSGGPLTLRNGNIAIQIGIVSFSIPCAVEGFPDVFTRVSKFLGWITGHTGINFGI